MKIMRLAGVLAVAAAASLASGERAQAAYSFSTAISITSITSPGTFTNSATGATATFGGTTVTLGNVTSATLDVPSSNTVSIANVGVTSTTPSTSSDTFSINYALVSTLTNIPPPGTAESAPSPTLTGTLTFTGINTGSGVITNVYTSPIPPTVSGVVGGVFFTGSALNFASPTVNGALGHLGGATTATPLVIPEPSSVVLLGLGLGGLGLLGFRKRRALA